MQATTQPITPAALDGLLAFLTPLFLASTDGNPQAARHAAAGTLQGYAARTEPELRLAAQIIAFSLRALETLARAAEPGLALTAMLRLHGNAATLHRAAMRCQKEFDKLHAQPLTQDAPLTREAAPATEADPRALAAAVPETLADTPPAAPPDAATPPVPALSRRQRRLAERLARRTERRQPELVRQIESAVLSPKNLEAAL